MLILYFTGVVNHITGQSWCPDCVVAGPNIKSKITDVTSLTVLKGTVESRDWIGKKHPYKTHGELQAGGVPCVLLWGNGQVLARAESRDDFRNKDLLNMIAMGE